MHQCGNFGTFRPRIGIIESSQNHRRRRLYCEFGVDRSTNDVWRTKDDREFTAFAKLAARDDAE